MKMLAYIAMELALFAGVALIGAQTPAPPVTSKLEPTEVQTLRLTVKQQAAKLAQRDLADAQARFNAAVAALNAEADKVRTEQGWDAKVKFDMDALTFTAPPEPPEAKKPEAQKP